MFYLVVSPVEASKFEQEAQRFAQRWKREVGEGELLALERRGRLEHLVHGLLGHVLGCVVGRNLKTAKKKEARALISNRGHQKKGRRSTMHT